MLQIEVNIEVIMALLDKYYDWTIKENDPDKGIPTWSIHVLDTIKELEFVWVAAGAKPALPDTAEGLRIWLQGYQYGKSLCTGVPAGNVAELIKEIKNEA